MNKRTSGLAAFLSMIALCLASAATSSAGQGGGGKGTSSTGTESHGGRSGTTTTTTSSDGISYATQTGSIVVEKSAILDINGQPSNSDGRNYQIDGQTLASQSEQPQPQSGTSLVQMSNVDGTFMVEVDGSGNPTGNRWQVLSDGQYLDVRPGVSMNSITEGGVVGSTSSATTGIMPDGVHEDSQLMGGIVNTLPTDADRLEGLISAVRHNADTHLDLSRKINLSTADPARFGTIDNPKLVYATGNIRPDGTVVEGDLQLSGSFEGAGILVVEINDPNLASVLMSGQSRWTGLIIVVSNMVPTGGKVTFETVGGGNSVHVVGGGVIYTRNGSNPADPSATILNRSFARLTGQSDIRFSEMALKMAHVVQPSVVEVRSWRRVPEGN